MDKNQQPKPHKKVNQWVTVLAVALSVFGVVALSQRYRSEAASPSTPTPTTTTRLPSQAEPPFLQTPLSSESLAGQTAVDVSGAQNTGDDFQSSSTAQIPRPSPITTAALPQKNSTNPPIQTPTNTPVKGNIATPVVQPSSVTTVGTPTESDMIITSSSPGKGNLFITISDQDGILDYSIQLFTSTQSSGRMLSTRRMESITVRSLVIPIIIPDFDATKNYTLEVNGLDIKGKTKIVRFLSSNDFR